MSGDVQPRKRKDRKKRRDAFERKSEGELSFSRHQSFQEDDESSHGVHITKMGGDDVHLHVQHEHGTGGHWCAKIFFFSLLAILLGLIALIILENRGLSDLDTPLSESRFSNYFDGWVEEHRQEHDDHDPVQASIEEHDEHDEPFEEEEDHLEMDEETVDEDDAEEHASEEGEQTVEQTDEEEEDDDYEGDDDEENATNEATMDATNEEVDNAAEESDDEDNVTEEVTREEMVEDDEDDDNTIEQTVEASQENEDNDIDDDNIDEENNDADGDNDDDEDNDIEPTYAHSSQNAPRSQQSNSNNIGDNDDDDDDPFDEEDDDGTFESLEAVVDNDAEELLLLQEKARQHAAEAAKNEPTSVESDKEDDIAEAAPSWASSLAVKIGVGVALALVARLVLIRNNPNTSEGPTQEVIMKRRLTIATAEETFPEDEDVPVLPDDEYSDEEVEIEEEIEYVEEEEIEVAEDEDEEMPIIGKYVPETFEELNAMYRSKGSDLSSDAERIEELSEPPANKSFTSKQSSAKAPTPVFNAPTPTTPTQTEKLQSPPKTIPTTTATTSTPITPTPSTTKSALYTKTAAPTAGPSPKSETKQYIHDLPKSSKHDVEYQPDDEDIDYDEDDDVDYDGEEMIGEEEEESVDDDLIDEDDDDEEISDVDDTELMSRLEAKYGRLPAKEYESDEDPDDPTWTQIKPKDQLGRGPQAYDDENDLFEQELRRANEEMMRERYDAASKAFALLARQYPDKPAAFLGKAMALDKLAEQQSSSRLLSEAMDALKRYLAFGALIKDNMKYRAAAERFIEFANALRQFNQAIPIYEQLIERFSNESILQNQLAVTYLNMNRLTEAKCVLQQILLRWPLDGFAQVNYGYVLRQHADHENAVIYLRSGINSKANGTQVALFFSILGDSLQRLGRHAEAMEVYKRGVTLKFFQSVYQRSLQNEPNLRTQPYWTKEETTYAAHLDKLERNWQAIRDEALGALGRRGYFLEETETPRDTGSWQQFELYKNGQRLQRNCQKAPITCSLIEEFDAATSCRSGQVKFSVVHPGTHVHPHCGPTNCRLRAHLGLVVPEGVRLRVMNEERNWTEGKFLIFDDSFEHELWHNGSSFRLVLIVDMWHPDLNAEQLRTLFSK